MKWFRWVQCVGLISLLFVSACAKHKVTIDSKIEGFEPISTFTGRLLVLEAQRRFQVQIDWQADEEAGVLRLTHALSGRIVDVQWQKKQMFWHDNIQMLSWHSLSEQELYDMGVVLPPWVLAKVFLGQYPKTMRTSNNHLWTGTWLGKSMQVKWSNDYNHVELVDFKNARKAVVIINE